MEMELQILMVEEDRADAMRLSRELRHQGIDNSSSRVETKDEFLHALQRKLPDIVLAGGTLGKFSGFAALELAREVCVGGRGEIRSSSQRG